MASPTVTKRRDVVSNFATLRMKMLLLETFDSIFEFLLILDMFSPDRINFRTKKKISMETITMIILTLLH